MYSSIKVQRTNTYFGESGDDIREVGRLLRIGQSRVGQRDVEISKHGVLYNLTSLGRRRVEMRRDGAPSTGDLAPSTTLHCSLNQVSNQQPRTATSTTSETHLPLRSPYLLNSNSNSSAGRCYSLRPFFPDATPVFMPPSTCPSSSSAMHASLLLDKLTSHPSRGNHQGNSGCKELVTKYTRVRCSLRNMHHCSISISIKFCPEQSTNSITESTAPCGT